MRRLLYILLLLIPFSAYSSVDSTYLALREVIKNKSEIDKNKQHKIDNIKTLLETPNLSLDQKYRINQTLFDEFKTFIADSAIFYTQQNLDIAQKMGDSYHINESSIDLAASYLITGMYIESFEILKTINSNELSDYLKIKYYDIYKRLYDFYSLNNAYTHNYKDVSNLYRDSLLTYLDSSGNHYKIVYADKLYDAKEFDEALTILNGLLNSMDSDTHEKAVVAYAAGKVYESMGDIEMAKKYFSVSAIADVKNSIKENASMKSLAINYYKANELEIAYRYIRLSMEDAMFCNAKLRTYEVSQIFPIIDGAYKDKIDNQNKKLQNYLIAVSFLSIFLIIAILYVYKQMQKVSRIRKQLTLSNSELNKLNNEIHQTNSDLYETNKVKEFYIGHFLDLCSAYISKLQNYQNKLNKFALNRKMDELFAELKSRDMIEQELKELYENFDNTFLHLYPNFVDEFNSLLLEEERFVFSPNEPLSVELRIYALIRLGITDSSKIASFLHYSANTIYSYRTRVRNKAAVPRDEFENYVMKIGTFQQYIK